MNVIHIVNGEIHITDHIFHHLGVILKLEIVFEYVIVVFPGGKVGSSPPKFTKLLTDIMVLL